ncbi:nuclear-pore anchor-like isoform X1 [Magnolia sinica]|uniref:nuclear-pore anchor-like isoform X1 n=1 Tax=Magnolia sinica TaxID=86752 RepID=UPI002658F5A5|nr:nuclear-pore anchor-like isoform X1 [Magnolia sinica]
MEDGTEVEKLTFKDVNGLVGRNVQLRRLMHSLSIKHDQIDAELKEKFEMELQKHIDEESSKVASVLERSEEQGRMIESLHDSVALCKRLYEEELKSRASYSRLPETFPEDGRKDLILLSEGSQQEATKKALEQASEQVRNLEDDLAKSR